MSAPSHAHTAEALTSTASPVVEAIGWQRITMRLSGTLTGAGAAGAGDGHASDRLPEFFLVDQATGDSVSLPPATRDADGFALECNMMRLADLYPLPVGTWALFARVAGAEGESIPVGLAENVSIPVRDYGGMFTTAAYRYWVLPGVVPGTDQFALEINYRRSPREPKPAGVAGLKRDYRDVVRRLRKSLFAGTYKVARSLVRKNGRRVLFTSDSRSGLSGNLEHIHTRMIERGLDREYLLSTAFKSSIVDRRPVLEKLTLPIKLALADVVLVDDFHPMLYQLDFDPQVRIIQVWHASGAFKTVGYSRVGKPGGPSPFANSHKNYTHAIVSSQHDVPFYAEAYGLPEERIHATGIPRMDLFFDDAHKARAIDAVHAALPRLRDSRVILFVPTFRGSGPSDAFYDYDRLDLAALHALCVEQDAVFVVKMHPFVRKPLKIPAEFSDRLIDATSFREVNDLLLVSDLVITDYSSVVFEYATLQRPMVFFAYDLDEYIASRDFYEEFTEFVPGKIVRTFPALLEALRTEDFEAEKVERFAAMHLRYRDAGSTDRVIDQLVLGRDAS